MLQQVLHTQCDQIGRFIGLLATFQSLWQQLICPNLLYSQAIFVNLSKSLISQVKPFLGNFYRHLAIFYWSYCSLLVLSIDSFASWAGIYERRDRHVDPTDPADNDLGPHPMPQAHSCQQNHRRKFQVDFCSPNTMLHIIPSYILNIGTQVHIKHRYAMNGLKYFLLQFKDCMMQTSCWQEGWPTSIDDPTTATTQLYQFANYSVNG